MSKGSKKDTDVIIDEYDGDYEAIQRAIDVAEEKSKRPKKGRGGTENFPNVLPSDISKDHISKTLNKILTFWHNPPVKDDDELADRLYDFFVLCMETQQHPTWEKLCYYIGFHGSTVSRWLTGEINTTTQRRNLIKKAKEFCAIYDAELAIDGKINPIIYIFRAKNFFGMVLSCFLVLRIFSPGMIGTSMPARRAAST